VAKSQQLSFVPNSTRLLNSREKPTCVSRYLLAHLYTCEMIFYVSAGH